MSETREREELHQLVDGMSDEQVRTVLDAARQVSNQSRNTAPADDLSWIGCITDAPDDLAQRAKDILRDEMGERHRRGPVA